MSAQLTQAISCRFEISDCCHDALFQSKYIRYQKANKLKILRCFPHCCPGHVYYRYCGAPICIATELNHSKPADNYISLLKIAPADDIDWEIGDVINPTSIEDLENNSQLGVSWYLGRQKFNDKNELVAEFNYDMTEGWRYAWKSGRSQVIRECLHYVKGFICEVIETNPIRWKVIAIISSPGFTFASYRSAPRVATDAVAMHKFVQMNTSSAQGYSLKSLTSSTEPPSPRHIVPSTQIMANRLGLLLTMITHANLYDISSDWQIQAIKYVLYRLDCRDQLSLTPVTPTITITTNTEKLSIVLQWFIHLLHPHNVNRYEAVILAHQDCVLDKATIATAYSDCVQVLHTISNDFLAKNYNTNVAAIVNQIAQDQPHLHQQVMEQVELEGYFGYQSLIAHFREVYLGLQHSSSKPSVATGSLWVYDTTNSYLEFPRPSLLATSRWLTWLYCIQVNLYTPNKLTIQSIWRLYPSQPTEFVLDNTPRINRLFPNGESTMSNPGYVFDGDYIGWTTSENVIVLECYRYDLKVKKGWRLGCLIHFTSMALTMELGLDEIRLPTMDDMVYWSVAD
ncbi:hypothetical protein THRCLA_06080, partial [Thraustotheca clavata]